MPSRVKLPLLQSTYRKPHMLSGSAQQLVNMYLEPSQPGYLTYGPYAYPSGVNMAAIRTPGTSLYLDLTGNEVRNLLTYQDNGYAVVDNTIYQIVNVNGNVVYNNLGTISSIKGRLSTGASPGGITWCDGNKVYFWNGGVISDITQSLELGAIPIWTTYKDGFTIYLTDSTNTVFVSDALDPTSVNPLCFFQVLSDSNPLKCADVSDFYIYFFGETGTEVWYTSGTGQFVPYSRVSGGILQVGIAAPNSTQVIYDNIYWLCQNNKGLLGVAMAQGPSYQIISSPDFVAKVGKYNSISDAFAYTDVYEGHLFYNICFPNAENITSSITRGRTWSIDIASMCIHERQSLNTIVGSQDRHIANCQTFFDGKQIVGDWQSGKLYISDLDIGTDNGNPISWEITTPHIIDRDLMFSVVNIEVDVGRGEGLDGNVQGSSPLIGLELSRDKGSTWGKRRLRNVNKIGDYKSRVRWGSLGSGRTMTLRFSGSDPIRWVINGMTAEVMTSMTEVPRSS
jgi:hypothetical protein